MPEELPVEHRPARQPSRPAAAGERPATTLSAASRVLLARPQHRAARSARRPAARWPSHKRRSRPTRGWPAASSHTQPAAPPAVHDCGAPGAAPAAAPPPARNTSRIERPHTWVVVLRIKRLRPTWQQEDDGGADGSRHEGPHHGGPHRAKDDEQEDCLQRRADGVEQVQRLPGVGHRQSQQRQGAQEAVMERDVPQQPAALADRFRRTDEPPQWKKVPYGSVKRSVVNNPSVRKASSHQPHEAHGSGNPWRRPRSQLPGLARPKAHQQQASSAMAPPSSPRPAMAGSPLPARSHVSISRATAQAMNPMTNSASTLLVPAGPAACGPSHGWPGCRRLR